MIPKFKGIVVVGITGCGFFLIGQFAYGLCCRYVTDQNIGICSTAGMYRFRDHHEKQQWFDNLTHGGWVVQGSVGFSSVTQTLGGNDPNFIGDGTRLSFGNGLFCVYCSQYYGFDVQHTLWHEANHSALAKWYNFTPGTDLKWSGDALDVVVMNNSPDSLWTRSWEQHALGIESGMQPLGLMNPSVISKLDSSL